MEEISKALALVSHLQTALSKNVCSEVLQDEKLWERFDVQCSQNVILFLNILTTEEKNKFMQWGVNVISARVGEGVERILSTPSPEIDSSGLRKEFIKPITAQPAPLPYIDMRNLRGKSKADLMKISETLQRIKRGEDVSAPPLRSVSPPRATSSCEVPPPNLSGKALVAFRREKINERRMASETTTVPPQHIPQAVSSDAVYMPSPEHFNTKRDFIHAREALRKANPNKDIVPTNEMHKLSVPTPPPPEVILVNPQPYNTSRFSQGKKGMILNSEPTIVVPRKAVPTQISSGMAMHRVVTQQRVR